MNEWSIDINSLRTLHAVLEASSVTAGAQQVGISQPAASAALARSRRAFDDALLVRLGRTMVRTPRGDEVLARTRELMATVRSIVEPTAPLNPATLQWHARIATSDHVAAILAPTLVQRLAREASGVTVAFTPIVGNRFDALLDDATDLVIGPPAPSGLAWLSHRPLFTDSYACLLASDHPAATSRLTLRRFLACRHLQVQPEGKPGGALDFALSAAGERREIVVTVADFWLAGLLTAASDLVTTVPTKLATSMAAHHNLAVRPVPIELPGLSISANWHRRLDDDQRLSWLLDIISSSLSVQHGP